MLLLYTAQFSHSSGSTGQSYLPTFSCTARSRRGSSVNRSVTVQNLVVRALSPSVEDILVLKARAGLSMSPAHVEKSSLGELLMYFEQIGCKSDLWLQCGN